MLPTRDFNLRPRFNRLTSPIVDALSTRVRAPTSLADLAAAALKNLDDHPVRERDAFGQRDELRALVDAAPVPAPPPSPAADNDYLDYLSQPVADDPLVDFPDLDLEKVKAQRKSGSNKGRRLKRKPEYDIRDQYKAAKKEHDELARRLRRVDTVEPAASASTALRVTGPGWSGAQSGYERPFEYATLLEEGFQFVPCDPARSLHLVSSDKRLLVYRSYQPPPATSEALARFVTRYNEQARVEALSSEPSRRGSHRPTLVGTTRAYERELHLTATHALAPAAVEDLVENDDLKTLSKFVSGIVDAQFPLVYKRYVRADPGYKNDTHPLRCRFGIFPLFCINHASEERVHCCPHADWKNVAGGVCAVMAYGSFDSKKRSWLVFKDLKTRRRRGLTLRLVASTAAVRRRSGSYGVRPRRRHLYGEGRPRRRRAA
ncbi:hypothetical protein JCM9279_005779 [Rhodotorula babjevae]